MSFLRQAVTANKEDCERLAEYVRDLYDAISATSFENGEGINTATLHEIVRLNK